MADLNNFDMMQIVEDTVCDLMDKFETSFGSQCLYEANMPNEILFSKRGTTAGVSHFSYINRSGYLNFNLIIMRENWDKFIKRTVPHEVAHYCVSLLHGRLTSRNGRRVIHGDAWKRMMRFFGVEDSSRCHSYDVSKARVRKPKKQRRWEYKCQCDTHMVSTTIHNKIRRGSNRICVSCRSRIYHVGGGM